MNIVLTGMMGTGKSAIGKALSRKLNMNFIDTDAMIEKDVGYSIPVIFKKDGEKYFRDVESKIIKCVSMLDNHVIATGGGVVLKKENMDELSKNGIIICLTSSAQAILERTRGIKSRPLLDKPKDVLSCINELLAKRAPFYAKANFTVNTSELDLDSVVNTIIKYLNDNPLIKE